MIWPIKIDLFTKIRSNLNIDQLLTQVRELKENPTFKNKTQSKTKIMMTNKIKNT